MFREWRIPCKPLLKEKGNVLVVRFRNVFAETLPKYQSAPYRLHAFGTNDQADIKLAMYSRKAQFHYGWDWGPRLITCGLWRPVLIEAWSGLRLKSVFVQPAECLRRRGGHHFRAGGVVGCAAARADFRDHGFDPVEFGRTPVADRA